MSRVVVADASGMYPPPQANVGSAAVPVQKLSELGSINMKALTRGGASQKVVQLRELPNVEIVECDNRKFLKPRWCPGWHDRGLCISCNVTHTHTHTHTHCVCVCVCRRARAISRRDRRAFGKDGGWDEVDRAEPKLVHDHLRYVIGMLPNCIIAYNCIIAFPLQPEVKATIVDPRDVADLAVALLLAPDPSS
jgi:hypothetical protein